MANLKLGRWFLCVLTPKNSIEICYRYELVEEDCNKCLDRDGSNLKALWRRGIARFEQGKLKLSLHDFEKGLALQPHNKAFQEQKDKIEKVLSKQSELQPEVSLSKAPSMQSELFERKQKPTAALLSFPLPKSIPRTFESPKTFFEFHRDWNHYKHDNIALYYYLKGIEPSYYPKLFEDSLETVHIVKVCEMARYFYMSDLKAPSNKDYVRAFQILNCLSKTQRFAMNVMFLSPKEKENIEGILNNLLLLPGHVKNFGTSLSSDYTEAEVEALCAKYKVRSLLRP